MTDDLKGLVERQVGLASLGIYEGITTGFAEARASWHRHDEPDYRWLLSMTARARMRDHWETRLPADGWTVEGNAALMGQTILVSPDRTIMLRLLKENPNIHPGGVPYAGHNAARQATWLQDPLPSLSVTLHPEIAALTTECLLLWDFEWDEGDPRVSTRVVHAIGTGRYGVRVPIDMSYRIDPSGTMYDQLKFEGAPQIEDLFPNIDKKDNESDASGQ